MNDKNFTVIKCPKCGYEYLPAEIFLPSSFLGKPKNIIRSDEGVIEFFNGETMNVKEEFECENCEIVFETKSIVTFTTEYDKKIDFDDTYETIIYKNRVKLEEPK